MCLPEHPSTWGFLSQGWLGWSYCWGWGRPQIHPAEMWLLLGAGLGRGPAHKGLGSTELSVSGHTQWVPPLCTRLPGVMGWAKLTIKWGHSVWPPGTVMSRVSPNNGLGTAVSGTGNRWVGWGQCSTAGVAPTKATQQPIRTDWE